MLRQAFDMIDVDGSGHIGGEEIMRLFNILDMEEEGARLSAEVGADGLTFNKIEAHLASQSFYKLQSGRYFVVLGLEEAEHLRGAMHLLKPESLSPGCGLAFRSVGNLESDLMDSLLDAHGPVLSSAQSPFQCMIAEQVFRFVNSSSGFTMQQLALVLQSLQQVPEEDRLQFWLDSRACRRRPQMPWQQLPLAKLFVTADAYKDLAIRATISRVRYALAQKRLWAADAFQKLDTNGSGDIAAVELFEGLRWLGVADQGNVTVQQLEEVFQHIDADRNGSLTLEEFKAVFSLDGLDTANFAEAAQADDEGPTKVEDGPAPASAAVQPLGLRLPPPPAMRDKGRFRVELQDHSGFQRVWTTEGTLSEQPLSIWKPVNLTASFARKVSERICLGYYAQADFNAPRNCHIAEVVDESGSFFFGGGNRQELRNFIDSVFPRPVQFRLVWEKRSGKEPLQVWEPIPPTEAYIALGVVATTGGTAKPPTPEDCDIRCVPQSWTHHVSALRKTWTDAGTGGEPATFWTSLRSELAVFAVAAGAQAGSASPPELSTLDRRCFFAEMPATGGES